jgi:hypothetical protein
MEGTVRCFSLLGKAVSRISNLFKVKREHSTGEKKGLFGKDWVESYVE